jgi:SET domain-containing protein
MSLTIKKTNHGLGLFATRAYKKDEFIIEYFGRPMTTAEADRSRSRYLFTVTSKWAIDGTDRANIARYINHSCKPNVIAVGSKRLWIHATRRIKPGEELTLDYGKDYLNAFIQECKCPAHDHRAQKQKPKKS